MRDLKRLFAAFIALSVSMTMFCSFVTVNAAVKDDNEIVSPANIAITAIENDISIQSGYISCYGRTETTSGYKSAVTVDLQCDNGGWTDLYSWTETGSSSATVDEIYRATSGNRYRLKLTYKAYDSNWNLIETITKYSKTVSY